MLADEATVTLWRPVGPKELDLIRTSGMRAFPPRLPERPVFYAYAAKIARDWNVRRAARGYVTRFRIARSFLDRYQVQQAGGRTPRNIGSRPRICRPSMTRLLARSKSSQN